MSESILRITIDSRNAEQNARNLSRELNSIERTGNYATRSMDSMSVATRSLAGYMAGIVTIGSAINKMDTYTNLQNKLKLVTSTQLELNTAMEDTHRIAMKTASDWTAVADVYSKYMNNAKTLNLTQKDAARLTEITSKAVAISGSNTQAAAGALFQYGQTLDGNILRAQEYNSLVDGAGGLLNAMAKGLNVTRGELRQMMLDGKLTGEVITKSLLKAGDSVDELYSKTQTTIKGSTELLSTQITKFTGEMSSSSGAAAGLADSIALLANNLETVADIAMLGGVAYLTKTIVAQTVATQSAITASIGRRAAMQAEMAATVQATALEIQRSRQIVASTLTEINLARQELNSATTRQARAAATMRLTQAEIAHNIAMKGSTAAIAANTAAQNALNASRAMGARMLALVGGPIGAITLGVTALAAGYMYMSSKGNESNEMLESQSQYAAMAADELTRLNGAQRKAAEADLSKEVGILNDKLKASENQFEALVEKVLDSNSANAEAKKIWSELRAGAIGVDEAYSRLNQTDFVTNDQINQLTSGKKKVDENRVAVKSANEQLDKVQSSGANAKKGFKDAANGAKDAQKEVATLNKDLADFNKTLQGREFDAQFSKQLLNKGLSEGQTKAMLEVANAAREKGVTATKEMYKEALRIYNLEKGVNDTIEAKNKLLKESTIELSKQQKVLQLSSTVQANAAKYNFSGLESKYGLPSGTLSSIHAIETGNTGKTNQVNKQTGATGGFQFLSGTAKQYGVSDRTNMAQSAEGAAKYMSYLLKLFKGDLEKAVRAYHAGEGNVQKGKNIGKYNNDYWKKYQGYMAGGNGYAAGDLSSKDWEKQLEDVTKMAEQQAELRKSLELDVANEVTRIRSELKDKLEQVDTAGFSVEKAKEVKAKLESQAESEIAIAEYALKTKLDDYSDFQKSESDLLKKSFDEKKFYASQDIELSKEGRAKAVELLDEQYRHEIALIELAKEERIFQMQQSLMSANAQSEKYWNLERQRIMLSVQDLQERNRQLAIANALQAEEKQTNLNSALGQWGQTEAEMRGTGDQYQLDQQRFSRLDQSQDVFDAQMALAETAEEREAIWQAHHDRMVEIEMNYEQSRRSLALSAAGDMIGNMTNLMGSLLGEQSAGYKAMFKVQKAFAIAEALLNAPSSYSKAYNSVVGIPIVGPYLAPVAGGVAVAAQLAQAASLKSVEPQGFATGGLITGPGTGTSDSIPIMASNEEYMIKAMSVKNVGKENLDYINKYGELPKQAQRLSASTLNQNQNPASQVVVQPVIKIVVPFGYTGQQSTDADGNVTIDVVKKIAKEEVQNSWSNLGRANSYESTQLELYGVSRVRG